MVELEKIIDYIRESRKKGFRDDVIKKRLIEGGYPWRVVDDAFFNSGKPKRFDIRHRSKINQDISKTSMTIILDKWMKDALEKKAKEDGLTPYNEVKKAIVNIISPSDIPKGVFPSRIIRKKMTDEEKSKHNASDRKHQIKVDKERRKKARILRREERRRKRKEKR